MEEKKKRKRRQSDIEATKRYDAKTYHLIGVKLRKEDDAEIIESFEAAHAAGKTSREWLREVFYGPSNK